ncbi:MAG: hypothetical protein K2X69_07465 [Silvanigrellaceae bacterium]|nr:hypothetical protein [Silvanigrellaceae bacterium]
MFIKHYENKNLCLPDFYKQIEYNLKKSKETIHEVYFWMHIQHFIWEIYTNGVFDKKKLIDNINLFLLNKDEKPKGNEICSYNVLRNYIENNELNWKYNGTIAEINNAHESFNKMIDIFNKVKNKSQNISLCFMMSILFHEILFGIKMKEESGHKISIIFEIKNSNTTIIFFDPNEGLYEFNSFNINELIRNFKSFYISIMKFIYCIKSISCEVLTLGFRARELGKIKLIRPKKYNSLEQRLDDLTRKTNELFGAMK